MSKVITTRGVQPFFFSCSAYFLFAFHSLHSGFRRGESILTVISLLMKEKRVLIAARRNDSKWVVYGAFFFCAVVFSSFRNGLDAQISLAIRVLTG